MSSLTPSPKPAQVWKCSTLWLLLSMVLILQTVDGSSSEHIAALKRQARYACEAVPFDCEGQDENMETVCTCGCIEISFSDEGEVQSVYVCDMPVNEHCLVEQEDIQALMEPLFDSDACACDDSGCSCIADECCWYESNGGFWTPHDACSEQPGDDDDHELRSLYDMEAIKVEVSSPGSSATNVTYRYIDFVLDDVDTAALAKPSTISSSYGFVQTVNYGTDFRERVLTSQTAHFTMNTYLECGFTQAVYELWVGRHYSPEIPVTLRFVRQDGTTPVSLSQIESNGYCTSPWDNHVSSVSESESFETTMTWSSSTSCSDATGSYTPRIASVNGHTLFRLRAGQETESSTWSQLFFVVDSENPC